MIKLAAPQPPGIPGETSRARRPPAGPLSVGSPEIPGGCASSRLDHGCKIPPGEAALAAEFSSIAKFMAQDNVVTHTIQVQVSCQTFHLGAVSFPDSVTQGVYFW